MADAHAGPSGNAVSATLAQLDYASGVVLEMDGTGKTFTPADPKRSTVRVWNRGEEDIWYRADGAVAVAEAATCVPLAAGDIEDVIVRGSLSVIGTSGEVRVMGFA